MSHPHQASEVFTAPPEPEAVRKAKAARDVQGWRAAAILFSQAADELPSDPHDNIIANEIGLRRDTHLCLCRCPEFLKYREHMPGRSRPLECQRPNNTLVDMLLKQRPKSSKVHLRKGIAS